ncbi:MarR family winged helix-turn-helix transcriptional regulator [Microbacterium sp. cx-55]|uniref:MarR family winged helix-turn-helix transcriptional regulator n=1 Tax=Microbacterium sp. cx-55 TaxID=2875948 RepID=UPI001CBB96CC|nr:MarR family winged helix-turn-helix transcriptional regulator [Microbacterium sp. cx-55]UGB35090.1 MarR family winged helix-turn-helix transcriptional regulator [Microbacterium sp. cx-55]
MADPQNSDRRPEEVIADALGRLRGRRGGWRGMPGPHDGPHHHGHSDGPFGRGDGHLPPRMPPWAGGRGRPSDGPAKMRVLVALASASGPLSVSEIGDAIGVDQPRASRLVQQGVEHGLLRREADPDDARRTRIVLTESGSAIANGFRGERREAIRTALGGLTETEQQEFARLLAKFADGWPQ